MHTVLKAGDTQISSNSLSVEGMLAFNVMGRLLTWVMDMVFPDG